VFHIGSLGGLVDTDAHSKIYVGCNKATSGAAEVSGGIWAMLLAVHHLRAILDMDITVVMLRFDSTYA